MNIKKLFAAIVIATPVVANAHFISPSCEDFDSEQAIHSLKFAMKQLKNCRGEFGCKVAGKLVEDSAVELANQGLECNYRHGYVKGIALSIRDIENETRKGVLRDIAKKALGTETPFTSTPRQPAESIDLPSW